jgi:hypothetical protein
MHLRLLRVPSKRPNRRSAKKREEIASYQLPPPRLRTALQEEQMIPSNSGHCLSFPDVSGPNQRWPHLNGKSVLPISDIGLWV